MKIFDTIKSAFSGAMKWLISPRAKQAVLTAGALAEEALPIVKEIDALVGGNPTLEAVAAAYEKFGVPFVAGVAQANMGNALLNLATSALQASLTPAQATVGTHILQTAVQLAVTATRAETPSA